MLSDDSPDPIHLVSRASMSSERKIQPGESVDDWIDRQPDLQRALLRDLRALVRDHAPHLSERVKWSAPWYEGSDNVAYLATHERYATFGICHGAALEDPDGLLEGTGKAMRHVKVRALDNGRRDQLRALLDRAVAYDRARA